MRHLILVASDGSESSERAVRAAATWALSCSARLAIVTIHEPNLERQEALQRLAKIEGGVGEAAELLTKSVLKRAKDIAERQGLTPVDAYQYWGEPAQTIMEVAEQLHPDVLVVGRRGRGQLAGLLLGSVSQKLVTLCAQPVMVVP